MKLIREINELTREKDEFELALEAVNAEGAKDCKKYFSPSRAKDFAEAIAELMANGQSYEDAKAAAFDETKVPPSGSPCCKYLRTLVGEIRKNNKPVKESEEVLTEARRKVGQKENTETGRKAVIYRDSEWEEFQVEFFKDGKKLDKATYHTDDKADANSTAEGFVSGRHS